MGGPISKSHAHARYTRAMRFTHEPLTYRLAAGEDTLIHRLRAFLGHHDLRFYTQEQAYIDVGRGSFDAVLRMEMVTPDFVGCVGTVGQMCDFSAGCSLMGGGEHWNELPVNVIFTNIPALHRPTASVPTLRPRPKAPFAIGNNVVMSSGTRVLAGAVVGDGAVLGAGALVSGELPAFSICGGVPARVLRQRFDADTQAAVQAVRWWDFDIPYLRNNLSDIQALATDLTVPHIYRAPQPRLVIRLKRTGAQFDVWIERYVVDGVERSLEEAPQKVRDYLQQMSGPGPYYWLADMWA